MENEGLGARLPEVKEKKYSRSPTGPEGWRVRGTLRMDLARPSESKTLWPPNRIPRTELTGRDRTWQGGEGCVAGSRVWE